MVEPDHDAQSRHIPSHSRNHGHAVMMPQPLMRLLFAGAAVGVLLAVPVSFKGYFARYHTVAARVAPNAHEYDLSLKRALAFDPSFNYANQLMAQYALREGKLGAAREYQTSAMRSFVSVTGLERMGIILSRLGDREGAREHLEMAVRVQPGNVSAMEQLALFAFDENDSDRLQELTAEILRSDLENLNAHYLRALDAQRSGNPEAALHSLQRVSAGLARGADVSRRFGGTREEVERRLADLKRAVEAR